MRAYLTVILSLSVILSLPTLSPAAPAPGSIVIQPRDFIAAPFMSDENQARVRNENLLRGGSDASYAFTAPQAGWYELYIGAANWPTDLLLDGQLLIYTVFDSGVWPTAPRAPYKVLNVYLTAGNHKLRFRARSSPGLPYVGSIEFRPATDLSGRVRVWLIQDRLCFRKDEAFQVRVTASKAATPQEVDLQVVRSDDNEEIQTVRCTIPAGDGNFEQVLTLPTAVEGVYDVHVQDPQGQPVDRSLQYLVVDTTQTDQPQELQKTLVQTIDCAAQAPDYAHGPTTVIDSPLGSYRQSGAHGVMEVHDNADYFAYTLNLPSTEEYYLAEIDVPDDDARFFTIYFPDNGGFGYAIAPGVVCGGAYPLSNKVQTRQVMFVPRDEHPRMIFTPWQSDMPAAALRIRIYRCGTRLPALNKTWSERKWGVGTEEAYRLAMFFGALPNGTSFANLAAPTEFKAQWSSFVGADQWWQGIISYSNILWPSNILTYDVPADTGQAVAGPTTTKEPVVKDLIRMMLLYGEKYHVGFVGEIHGSTVASAPYEQRIIELGKAAGAPTDGKPWIIISREGKGGDHSPYLPYYNPLYPGVQDFFASIIQELAQRYKDSPAFQGLAMRLGGWCFGSFQCFPSMEWGYEDYTIGLFEKDTGVQVPVDPADPQRYQKRYDWLMAKAHDKWVNWRCAKIHAYWTRLAGILHAARPDLKFLVEMGNVPAGDDKLTLSVAWPRMVEQEGFLGLARDQGIDPAPYAGDSNLVLLPGGEYPAGYQAAKKGRDPDFYSRVLAERWAALMNPLPLAVTAKPLDGGVVNQLEVGQSSYETEVPYKDFGLQGATPHDERFGISGSISPAGRNYLEYYALSLADGNVIGNCDFQREVVMDQYEAKREFLREYHALPAIPMARLRGDDPVAVWQGRRGDRTYFYLVNRAYYPVTAAVRLAGEAHPQRLTTGEAAPLQNGVLNVTLQPFQLLAYVSTGAGRPSAIMATAPAAVLAELQQELAFVQNLLSNSNAAGGIVALSPVDFEAARQRLTESLAAMTAGRPVETRHLLMHPDLARAYEAFNAWPPGIWQAKLPDIPRSAMTAPDIAAAAAPESHATAVEATSLDLPLAGANVATWQGGALSFTLEAPQYNVYRLSYGYLTGAPYRKPALAIDGQPVPGQSGPATATTYWGSQSPAQLVLTQGKHQVTASLPAGASGGLIYFSAIPHPRPLTADLWSVIGPFPSQPVWTMASTGIDIVYPPEPTTDLSATYPGAGGQQISWQVPAASLVEGDHVNLYRITGVYDTLVSYLVTYINSPEARSAVLSFGVDYWAKIWLNGQPVFQLTEGHGAPCANQYQIPLQLQKGRNELKVKVNAGSAGNGIWISLSDPGDLTYSPR